MQPKEPQSEKGEARKAMSAYKREWREKNKQHVNAYASSWRKKNKEKVKQYNETYWERKGAVQNDGNNK